MSKTVQISATKAVEAGISAGIQKIPTYCFQCPDGPDPIYAVVKDGVLIGIEPMYELEKLGHPSRGRTCPKAYGLILKTYNPYRIKKPLIRTNPNKGWDQDPGWKEISWDEALNILAEKLKEVRKKGVLDEYGRPRVAAVLGGAGVPEGHFGTFPAFLSAWGPVDLTLGTGQGYKCYHTEHILGEYWHRAFIVVPDVPLTKWVLSFGGNDSATQGTIGNALRAEARARGTKRIQVEPHASMTAAASDEWIPIKPKTDAAFLYAMIYVILYELDWRKSTDIKFLKERTNSPYLIGPKGYYCRDPETLKPLIWDPVDNKPKTFDDLSIKDFALDGEYTISKCVEIGPDNETYEYENVKAKTAFQLFLEHMKEYTPEWAEKITGVPASTIRRIAREFVENAMIGATINIDGEELPYRPVAITLGKTVNNGPGAFETVWARTVLMVLVGGLEVPGGVIGTGARLNPPQHDRWASVIPGPDGFMMNAIAPTDKDSWPLGPPFLRGALELTPLNGYRGWAAGLAAFTFAWLSIAKGTPENWPRVNPPDVYIVYRANPLSANVDRKTIEEALKKIPFIVVIGYIMDETSWFADLILPESIDTESYQLFRFGSTTYTGTAATWPYFGFALKQPVVKPMYDTKDPTDIWTELAARVGILDKYYEAINRGAISFGQPLKGPDYDYTLKPDRKYSAEEIWDRIARVVTRWLSNGKEEKDLNWFKEHGFYVIPYPRIRFYLHPIMVKLGLRYELPYLESIKRMGEELRRRLHERNIHWWDDKLKHYEALPKAEDYSKLWDEVYGPEYDTYIITSKNINIYHAANVYNPMVLENVSQYLDIGGVVINPKTAAEKGIKDGDIVIIESPRGKVKAKAIVREGIMPGVALLVANFGQKIMPVAKDFGVPSMNELSILDWRLLDEMGGTADLAKVKIYKAPPGEKL